MQSRPWLFGVLFLTIVFESTGCLRKHTQKPADNLNIKLPAPTPVQDYTATPPQPVSVQPPQAKEYPGITPALPGMPGSPSQPISTPQPPSGLPGVVPDSPIPPTGHDAGPLPPQGLGMDEPGDGPIRRVIENIRERREEKKELPPATEPITPPPPPPESTTRMNTGRNTPAPNAALGPQFGQVATARAMLEAAVKKYATIPDYECRLTRREVVNGKATPTEEVQYQFRKEPMSLYMKVIGEQGRGREVLYVAGKNNGKMVLITGEGDNRLLGAGKKMELDPTSSLVTAKSRHRITEAGMGRQLTALTNFIESAEKGTRPVSTIRVSSVERKEYPTPLQAIEVTLQPGDDPLLPRGGKRTFYFDTNPKSDAVGLPVMVITLEPGDKEVEYYCFREFRMPAKLSDFDFSPERLGKR
jgi:hypothetical protein